MATISGPHEGMYLIQQNHINVKLPKDCTDDNLIFGENIEPIMGPQPTCMIYFLERVKLAHLCREMVDLVPVETSKLAQLPYEHIVAFDKKLVGFISSLPFFFRLDPESRRQAKPLETIYPHLPLLRYCITKAAHSRRCKLHQRFLLRQSSDPLYAYSRQACLESARIVIQFHDGLTENNPSQSVTIRMGLEMHFMHLALAVLVMDLCFNRDQVDEMEIKAEVKNALRIFEGARHGSPLLGRFLSSLRHILQKHSVYLTDPVTSATSAAHLRSEDNCGTLNSFDSRGPQSIGPGRDIHDGFADTDISFDDFWQAAVQSEPNLDLLAWDNLFSALDSRTL